MSKELTPLEALRGLMTAFRVLDQDDNIFVKERMQIIEEALNDYENLKLKHKSMQDAVLEDFKKLKAFDLLIKKLDTETLLHWLKEHSTEEEFDFLKEILL